MRSCEASVDGGPLGYDASIRSGGTSSGCHEVKGPHFGLLRPMTLLQFVADCREFGLPVGPHPRAPWPQPGFTENVDSLRKGPWHR